MEEIKKNIIEKISDLQPYIDFAEDTKLLQEDILDSVSVLVLVQDLEEEYDISIDAEEITGDNFESVIAIANLIQFKQNN